MHFVAAMAVGVKRKSFQKLPFKCSNYGDVKRQRGLHCTGWLDIPLNCFGGRALHSFSSEGVIELPETLQSVSIIFVPIHMDGVCGMAVKNIMQNSGHIWVLEQPALERLQSCLLQLIEVHLGYPGQHNTILPFHPMLAKKNLFEVGERTHRAVKWAPVMTVAVKQNF